MQQPYDTTFKAFLEGREPTLIPYILPNTRYLAELNIEQLRAPLRADRVYKIEYEGAPAILHIEIEAVGGPEMAKRMLEYHGILHKKHDFPVISLVLYPFQTTMVQSPYQEFIGSKPILTFHFEVVALWEVDARPFVEQKAISMYSLLPTMKGVTADLLLQAIKELREAYQGVELSQQLLWLQTLLHRAHLLSPEEQQRVEEDLKMFENLLEESPYGQKMQAKGEAKGRIEGKRSAIIAVIRPQYPQLVDIAQQKLAGIEQEEQLENLLIQVVNHLGNESSLRQLLTRLPS